MSNNTPDYENDIVFEPKMTWEDLVSWAKSIGIEDCHSETFIRCNGLAFINNNSMLASGIITRNISYEQMQAVLKALHK